MFFFCPFCEGENFGQSWLRKPFKMGILSKIKKIALTGANSFPLEVTPIEKGGRNKSGRVAFPELYPLTLIQRQRSNTDIPHLFP